jgi:bacterioferritin (cytochrome b1)
MKKYYLMAIEYDEEQAMNNLDNYYHYVEKNYDLMKKYYFMAINNDNEDAIFYLNDYFRNIKKIKI